MLAWIKRRLMQKKVDKFWEVLKTDDLLKICLAAKGVDINFRTDKGFTILHRFIELFDFYNSVEALISLGADVNTHCKYYGTTPLMTAVYASDKQMTKMLLEAGANINAQDNRGWTVLHTAMYRDDHEFISFLLDAEADPSITTKQHYTARMIGSQNGSASAVLELEKWQKERASGV